ncbi:MAG: GAF domain-containing protein [Anaerolineae bacterium]|nr:GAF domain-containing protein [Anaerolineae bacterium]
MPTTSQAPAGANGWITPVAGTLVAYAILTVIINYLVAMETRQARISRDTSTRLRRLSTVHEVSRTITSTLDMEAVLNLVVSKAVEILDAEAGSLLLLEESPLSPLAEGILTADVEEIVRGDLVFRVVYGPVAKSLLGKRVPASAGIAGAVLKAGEGQFVNHVQDEPRWNAVPDVATGFQTRSLVCVPLLGRGRPIGVLEVLNKREGLTFDEYDLELLSAFASQAAIALENARLYEKTDEALGKRLREMAAIEEVDHLLGASLDYQQIPRLILQRAVEVCNADFGAIGIIRPSWKRMSVSYWPSEATPAVSGDLTSSDAGEGLREWPMDRGIVGRVATTGQPVLVPDVSTDPDYAAVAHKTQSEVAVPIRSPKESRLPTVGGAADLGDSSDQGRVIGVLNLESDRLGAFTEDHLHFLEHLADHAGFAIEKARAFEEERRRVEVLSTVSDINKEISSSLDLERILTLILAHVKKLVDYYIAEICLWDEAQQVMVTWASAGDARYTARTGGIYHLNEGYTGWIARNRQELLVSDTSLRQDVHPKIVAEDMPVGAYVGLPLKTGETFVGSLELASDRPGVYDQNSLEFLRIIADQAAVAIHNARLYGDAQRRFEQTQLVLRVTESLSSIVDVAEAMRRVARELCRALQADMAGVYLPDETGTHLRTVAGYHVPKDKLDVYREFKVPIQDHPFIEEVWRTRQAIYSTDPRHDPRIHPLVRDTFPHQTTLLAPMVARDKVIGGVYLSWVAEKKELAAEELQLANALGQQAGAMVENAQLFEAQQSRLKELGILFETSAAISSSLELHEVLQAVARQMANAIGVSSCAISDWDPDRNVVVTLIDESPIGESGDVGSTFSLADYQPTKQVLLTRQPYTIHASDPGADPVERALLEKGGQKSCLMLPLVSRDQVMGLVELFESRHEHRFSPDEVRLSQALANQAAVAIENARLYARTDRRLQARVEELTALQRTTQELNATLDLDTVVSTILESAVHTTGATHGNIMLRDLETGQLALRSAQGYSEEEQEIIAQRLLNESSASISYLAAEKGEPRIVYDAQQDETAVFVKPTTRSALVVPIFQAGMVVGLINLRHTEVRAFDDQDLTFVQALAEQASAAIGNALRFEEQASVSMALTRRTEQMDSLLAISQKLRADVPLADVLEEIAYGIQETVGFNAVLVSVAEGRPPVLRRVAAAGLPVDVFEEMKRVLQPLSRYERILTEEYRQGACYFFPFQKRGDWATDVHTYVPLPGVVEWQEGQWHPNDMLLAPLRGTTGQLLGVISVDDPINGQRPSQSTLEALAIFANQASLAVENAALYADVQRRADNLAQINRMGRVLTQALEPGQVVNTVVKAVTDLLRCELSAVFLTDPLDSLLGPVASQGVRLADMSGLRFAPGEGLVGQVAAAGAPLAIPDTDQEPRFVPGPAPIGSMLLAPMMVGKRVLGVLTAGSAEKHRFGAAEQVLLATLADQATVALESAHLFEGTQQAALRLSLLNEIGRRAASQLELQEMLDTAVDALHQNLGYFRVAVLLRGSPSGEKKNAGDLYVAAANKEFWEVIPPDYRQKIGDGLIGAAAASGDTILCNDTAADKRYYRLGEWDSPASLSVPIRVGDRVLGVLEAEADRPGVFADDDAAALEIAADQLAVAIQNAALFQERERRIAELAVLNDMSRAISSALDLDALLETVEQQVRRLFDTTSFYIATYLEGSDEWTLAFALEHGQRFPPNRYDAKAGITGYVLRTRQPLLLSTLAELQAFHDEHGIATVGEVAKSWMGVPLLVANQVVGVMGIQSYEQEYLYSPQDMALFSTIAAQTAVAIANARLYQEIVHLSSELEKMVEARTQDLENALGELTKQRDRAEILYRITSELGTTLDLERVLERALFLFADALKVEHGTIMLLEQETGDLYLKATLERGRQLPREGERTLLKRGVGLAGWVLESRQPALVPDVTQDDRWLTRSDKPFDFHSVVCVPLSLGGGDVLGVLTLGHSDVGYFGQEHLELVTAAAAQMAIAVNNSDLYAYITEQADQLGVMLQTQRAESAKSQAILESIADGVIVLDDNGRVLLVNPAAEEMLGISSMVLQGEHFRHMLGIGETAVHRELADKLYAELKKKLEAGETELRPSVVRMEAGTRVFAVGMSPLITGVGQMPGLVAAMRDISREAEVERLKNEFISTVSHELRTPMTSIKGFTDLLFLGMAGGLTDTQRSFLQIIKSNVDRLTALVNDILDISRIETGRLRLTIEALDLGRIVSQVVTTFQAQYDNRNLALFWDEPQGLPRVRGDEGRITQILTNLIANAWQYTPSGGQVTVTLGPAKDVEGYLQVDVADTGIGIASDDLARIFDRFYRVDSPAVQEVGGSGLGLSIVKMFVEMLGGKIWVESEPGKGSTFSFTMPEVTAEMPEEVTSADLLTSEATVLAARRPKILVVEDDREVALLLRRQLEVEGYNVLLAGSGQDALWLAREEQPQLITLDIMLPDLDGFVVLEQLKDHPVTAPIPVIIVSMLGEVDKGYALGAVDYVVKPFDEEQLLASIRQVLDPARKEDGAEPARNDLLVVDDEPDIIAFLEQALSAHGYQVRSASNGHEALERVRESMPDLILLDLRMPVMDGYEVIRQLKGDEATIGIPIIVITASPVDKERDRVQVLGMGVTQYMAKPLSVETIVAEIKRATMER